MLSYMRAAASLFETLTAGYCASGPGRSEGFRPGAKTGTTNFPRAQEAPSSKRTHCDFKLIGVMIAKTTSARFKSAFSFSAILNPNGNWNPSTDVQRRSSY